MSQQATKMLALDTKTGTRRPFCSSRHSAIQFLGSPVIAATNRYLVSCNLLTSHSYTPAAQPDVPRNITIAVTDTTPSITAGTITVSGYDVHGDAVSEVLDLSTGLTLTGTLIFAVVSSIVTSAITILGGAGDELIVVGCGSVIGLPDDLILESAVTAVWLGGTALAAPVIAVGEQTSGVNASSGTYNGTKVLLVAYNPGE